MFRLAFTRKLGRKKDGIVWRGHEVTRIEAFSDAVFAFSITLLIVALEVPESYLELMKCMTFFVPFAVCFIILFMIWYTQNMFFRRFGMQDNYTIILNGVLLFFVLFFVYPLKFLFSSIFSNLFDIRDINQLANLFYIYSGGFAIIYFLFGLMYQNATRNKDILKLTNIELYETRTHMFSYLIISIIALCSMLLAFLGEGFIQFAGIIYILIGPAVSILYSIRNKKIKLLQSNTITIDVKKKNKK